MGTAPITFDDVIAPLSRERFLSEFWAKSFLHSAGQKGRFTPLLPWDELNAILEWHCPPQPQLRLSQDGKAIDVRRYIDGPVGSLKLNAGGLIAALSQGASLILDSVHEVAPRVSQLAEAMQDIFEGTTIVNLYAGWRKQNGFDLHWDAQDLFVLQLSGRKHWKVYRPTGLYPLGDDVDIVPKPTEPPVWDAIINDGDMLHVPRGWWHMAYPLDEPSLHLTFSVMPPNGADFLAWWTRKMLQHPDMRKNLPHQSNAAARREYSASLKAMVEGSLAGDSVGEFLRYRNAVQRTRPRIRLPLAPIEQAQSWNMATRIRLATAASVSVEIGDDNRLADFRAGAHAWSSRRELIPVFQRLTGHTSIALEDLCAGIRDQQLINALMTALEKLANGGVIFKENPEAS